MGGGYYFESPIWDICIDTYISTVGLLNKRPDSVGLSIALNRADIVMSSSEWIYLSYTIKGPEVGTKNTALNRYLIKLFRMDLSVLI